MLILLVLYILNVNRFLLGSESCIELICIPEIIVIFDIWRTLLEPFLRSRLQESKQPTKKPGKEEINM